MNFPLLGRHSIPDCLQPAKAPDFHQVQGFTVGIICAAYDMSQGEHLQERLYLARQHVGALLRYVRRPALIPVLSRDDQP